MKIDAYLPNYNEKHCQVLRALADGIPGARVRTLGAYVPCDIAIIFGAHKYAFSKTLPKKEILQKHQGRRLLMVESAFVLRGDYYQIGWGGYAGNADFCNEGVPSDRWDAMGVPVQPWQKRNKGPIVVCGQLGRDTQVQDTDHYKWCRDTVRKLQQMGETVIFRPHPREKDPSVYRIPKSIHHTGKFAEVLKEAKCVVIYNSTSGVDALIAGVPVIASHPSAISYPIAQHELTDVKALKYPDRTQFFAGLGYAQWTPAEMRAGLPWKHLNRG